MKIGRFFTLFVLCYTLTLSPAFATQLNHITIVNGSYGGGWELTARVTGENLVQLGLATSFSIETVEGGAGARALEMFLRDERYKNSILVQSEPLISGFLKKSYQKGFRDLRPIALMAAEYACLLVPDNSPYHNALDVVQAINNNRANVPISLGGRYGTGDHIVANMIFRAARIKNPNELRYMFSNGGDKATIQHLSKSQYIVGVSGYNSITTDAVNNQRVRVLGLTSSGPIDGHRSLRTQGIDLEYANWRGFFARKDMPEALFQHYLNALTQLAKSPEWQQVLKQNNWSPFFMTGPELNGFLLQHEQKLKTTMQQLKIIQ